MNLLEHYIVKILEVRQLNDDEIKSFEKLDPLIKANLIFAKYEANCYGSHSIIEDYYQQNTWDKIVEQGYELR